MQSLNGVLVGYVDARCPSSIQWIAEHEAPIFLRFPYALIAQVDSVRPAMVDDPMLHRLVKTARVDAKQTRGGILLISEHLVRVAVEGFFTGFDEVWLFSRCPDVDLPDGVRVPCRGDEADAAAWMSESGAVLGLADGIGLHYVTTDRGIAETLTALSFADG